MGAHRYKKKMFCCNNQICADCLLELRVDKSEVYREDEENVVDIDRAILECLSGDIESKDDENQDTTIEGSSEPSSVKTESRDSLSMSFDGKWSQKSRIRIDKKGSGF